jgi:hypothetical protein
MAKELGCSPVTERTTCGRAAGLPYRKPSRNATLDVQREWLRQRVLAHRRNADVMRQELELEEGIRVSLRTAERAVEPWRRELNNVVLEAVRIETPPGKQLQADVGQQCLVSNSFGEDCVYGGERLRAFRAEKKDHWLEALEEGFRLWGGVPHAVLKVADLRVHGTTGEIRQRVSVLVRDQQVAMLTHLRLPAFRLCVRWRCSSSRDTLARTSSDLGAGHGTGAKPPGGQADPIRQVPAADSSMSDEMGYLTVDPNGAYLFFQLLCRCDQRGSVALTSNRPVMEWGEMFGGPGRKQPNPRAALQ